MTYLMFAAGFAAGVLSCLAALAWLAFQPVGKGWR